jgi:DUF1009 family protein
MDAPSQTTTMATTERSRPFVPQSGERVAIAAGSGKLPIEIADALTAAGHKPFVVLIEGEADPASPLASHDHWLMPLEQIGQFVAKLRTNGVTHLVMAGGIARRPDWRSLRPSLGLLRIVPPVVASLARGDDNLLKALIRYFESEGFRIVGAHDILPDLLAARGVMTRAAPSAKDRADLHAAAVAARAIGALDIGQAAIAIGGRAVALEGVEGTDGLLDRTRELRSNGRIAGIARGVLVKCAKPGQELRADLPTIGPATVTSAHAAGLAGIGVEADRSIILDQAAVIARADDLGLFVVGLSRQDYEQ